MRTKQAGFTLIELVVVIVILGILAAVATPRFVDLTSDAEEAVCQGVVGALYSSAVLLLAQNDGQAQSRSDIIDNTAVTNVHEVSAGTAAGVIDVEVTDGGTSCATDDLQALGLSSD